MRLRYAIRLSQPLHKSAYYVFTANELMVNLNTVTDGPQQGIDRNRTIIGVGRKINKETSVETGYRYEYINRTDRDNEARQQIVLQLSNSF